LALTCDLDLNSISGELHTAVIPTRVKNGDQRSLGSEVESDGQTDGRTDTTEFITTRDGINIAEKISSIIIIIIIIIMFVY